MNQFIIAKEGFRLILWVFVFAVMVFIFSDSLIAKLAVLVLLAGVIYLFRKTKSEVERFEKCEILAVGDGIVTNIETLECQGKIKGECYKLTIINRFIDKGELRAPFDCTIPFIEYRHGMQLALHSKKSERLNETCKILFQSSDVKDDVMVVRHRLNRFNIPLSFAITSNDELDIGTPYGFMLHGSLTIFLPTHSRLAVKVGDEVKAGETLIGYFTR